MHKWVEHQIYVSFFFPNQFKKKVQIAGIHEKTTEFTGNGAWNFA